VVHSGGAAVRADELGGLLCRPLLPSRLLVAAMLVFSFKEGCRLILLGDRLPVRDVLRCSLLLARESLLIFPDDPIEDLRSWWEDLLYSF
jgi:hypothetical protein